MINDLALKSAIETLLRSHNKMNLVSPYTEAEGVSVSVTGSQDNPDLGEEEDDEDEDQVHALKVEAERICIIIRSAGYNARYDVEIDGYDVHVTRIGT